MGLRKKSIAIVGRNHFRRDLRVWELAVPILAVFVRGVVAQMEVDVGPRSSLTFLIFGYSGVGKPEAASLLYAREACASRFDN